MITPEELRTLAAQAKAKAEEEMNTFLSAESEKIEKICIEKANDGLYSVDIDISFVNIPHYFNAVTAVEYISNYFKKMGFSQYSCKRSTDKITLTLGWFEQELNRRGGLI